LSDSDKTALTAAIEKVNEAKKGEDAAAINRAVDDLQRASQAMSEHLYAAATPPGGAPGGGPAAGPASGGGAADGAEPKPDDVIDVEFEEKK
jgi:molecular chaperone DnaK